MNELDELFIPPPRGRGALKRLHAGAARHCVDQMRTAYVAVARRAQGPYIWFHEPLTPAVELGVAFTGTVLQDVAFESGMADGRVVRDVHDRACVRFLETARRANVLDMCVAGYGRMTWAVKWEDGQ